MKAIILAAGQGTRLKKYTKNLPKGMLMFNGKTIIERQIEEYRAAGIKDIIVVRGFAADKIQYEGVKYYTNEKFATTNMVESLMCARSEFGDDCIVSYSDILFTQEMLQGMMAEPHDFTVAVDDNWKAYWQARYGRVDFDTESLEIDDNDNILSLGQEAPNIDDISARYIGLLKFSKKGLQQIVNILEKAYSIYEDKPWMLSGKHIRQAYMTDLLMALIKHGYEVKASHYQNGWVEFDTNGDYETACEWVKNGIINSFINVL